MLPGGLMGTMVREIIALIPGDTLHAMANQTARSLRKRMTPQEVKLWVKLRAMKALGYHFRRQAPIDSFIVDFVCFKQRLVIEVDGGQHGRYYNQIKDAARDA